MLTIFSPYRNRPEFYQDFVAHYRQRLPGARIYMLEQDDNTLFKRGQLMNVAFGALVKAGVPLDDMMFIDVDIRMKADIPFEEYLRKFGTVVIPYNQLELCRLDGLGQYVPENKPSYFLDAPDGGVTLFTRAIFEACNGFSNLYIGWGREDSDFVRRNKVIRVKNEMIHLTHERHSEWKSLAFKRNDDLFKKGSDFHKDGFRQTTGDITIRCEGPQVFHCRIKNIGTSSDFAYKYKMIPKAPCGVK